MAPSHMEGSLGGCLCEAWPWSLQPLPGLGPGTEAPVAIPWSEKPDNLSIHLRVQKVIV